MANPNGNTKNLVPQNRRTKKEQRKIAQQGGKASGVARKTKKNLKETMLLLLSFPVKSKAAKILEAAGFDSAETNNYAMLAYTMLDAAINRGDMKAAKAIMDLIGAGEIFEIKNKELKLKEKAIKSAETQSNQTSSAMQQLVNSLMASDS